MSNCFSLVGNGNDLLAVLASHRWPAILIHKSRIFLCICSVVESLKKNIFKLKATQTSKSVLMWQHFLSFETSNQPIVLLIHSPLEQCVFKRENIK